MSDQEHFELLTNALEKTTRRIVRLTETRKLILSQLRERCTHSKVVQAPYQPPGFILNMETPFRVCEDCGLSEVAWEFGYKILTTKYLREVSREEGYNIRNKFR